MFPYFHDVLLEVQAIHNYIIIFVIFLTIMEGVVKVEWHGQDLSTSQVVRGVSWVGHP